MKFIQIAITTTLALAGVALFGGRASAAGITILNFSFEAPEEGNSGASTVCPTSWTCTPAATGSFNVGVFSPVNPTQYASGSDGLPAGHTVPLDGSARTNTSNVSGGYQALYTNFNSGGETVSQDTSALIANGITYTLDVWVGHRLDFAWGNAILEFLANGVVWHSSAPLADPGAGKWAEYKFSYTATASDSSKFGQTLGIGLLDNSPNGGGQTNWDVVRLTQGVIPEPATLSLVTLGLLGLGARVRAQRARKS